MRVVLCWILLGMLAAAEPEGRVAEIRKWYDAVQEGKATGEKKIAFEAEDDPLAGELTVQEYADGLKAITLSYSEGDHGGADEHYYFRKGELFFVYEVRSSWQFGGKETAEGEPGTIDRRTENRYYFEDGKCFRQLTRTGSGADAEKLPAVVGKLEQKGVTPGAEAVALQKRAMRLLKVGSAEEILSMFLDGPHGE